MNKMIKPSLEEAKAFAKFEKYNVLPLSMEIYADIVTPTEVVRILKNVSKSCFLLESVENNERWGRYSFLGFDPKLEITCTNWVTKITTPQTTEVFENDNPNPRIQAIIDAHKSVKIDGLPPFAGGLVGYFAYDYVKYTELSLQLESSDQVHFRDLDLMLFDKVIAFDHYRQKIILIVNISLKDLENSYEAGIKQLKDLKDLIENGIKANIEPAHLKSDFKPLFSKESYIEKVKKAKDYIKEGDIFQVVLSNWFSANFEGSLFNTYRALRTINPSPYMFYFSGSDLEIAGASPETLVKLTDGKLFTFPLAGTRPRGSTEAEELALEKELLADEKELAEHNMLVDLGRNDLGKISKFGTVEVEEYMSILKFSHVMHIGSTVTGQIQEEKTGLDAINAVLPAGTLSGAPKVRAMEIINELEQTKRGVYGGAIGYLDFTGNMDTCIGIRIAYKKADQVFVRAGAGIVADSNPELEYEECVNKSKGMRFALEESSEGGLAK